MKLIPAGIEHSALISSIYCRSWKQTYVGMIPPAYLEHLSPEHWTAAFEKWIGEQTYDVLIAWEGQVALGAVCFGASREDPGWGEIQSIYVLPEFWGKGYGKALMHGALTQLRQKGFGQIYLWVLDQNKKAQGFYQSLGFAATPKTYTLEIHGAALLDYRYEFKF